MTNIHQPVSQRLNYFHGQFLHEKDFIDEQNYLLDQQRSHARLLHTPGIAEGMGVNMSKEAKTGTTDPWPPDVTVTVSSGIAYDAQGRRIVLDKAVTLTPTPGKAGENYHIYVTISYTETEDIKSNEGGWDGFTRIVEGALVKASASQADDDSVLLAEVIWDATTKTVILDTSHRPIASAKAHDLTVEGDLIVKGTITGDIAVNQIETGDLIDKAVTSVKLAAADGLTSQDTNQGSGVKTSHLQDQAVTLDKLALEARPITSIAGISNPGGKVEISHSGAITVDTDVDQHRITIGETHSSLTGNPHKTTAADVGALVSVNSVSNPDGNIDFVQAGAITISADLIPSLGHGEIQRPREHRITIGETHSSRTDNPHNITAEQVGALVSVNGVNNPGGNIDLVQTGAITISTDLISSLGHGEIQRPREHRITIGETHSSRTDNPHQTTAAQVGAVPASGGVIFGNLGIGVTPKFPLDLQGRMRIRQISGSTETAGIWLSGYYRQETDTAFLGMQRENTVGIFGNIGNPGWRLIISLDSGDLSVTGNAFKPGGGAWATPSDVRLKQDVRPLNDSLDRLLKLKPISFEWKEPDQQGNLTGRQIGFLADDVEEVFPQWVGVDRQGMKTLSIRGFEALAVEALKQLKQENDQLKAALATMQEKIDALEKRRGRLF